MELDTDPPPGAQTDVQTLLLPIPFQVRLFASSSLFAGKVHALLCWNWKGRVKGRDFHDFVWYLGRAIPVHLEHLQERMKQSGHWHCDGVLNEEKLKTLLRDRFAEVDYEQAKDDVLPFIEDADAVTLWNSDFFLGLLDRLKIE